MPLLSMFLFVGTYFLLDIFQFFAFSSSFLLIYECLVGTPFRFNVDDNFSFTKNVICTEPERSELMKMKIGITKYESRNLKEKRKRKRKINKQIAFILCPSNCKQQQHYIKYADVWSLGISLLKTFCLFKFFFFSSSSSASKRCTFELHRHY